MPLTHKDLVLGPLLRRVDGGAATIWVETSRPTTVEVRAGDAVSSSPTFSAFGHHYALVIVEGLPDGAAVPYEVALDGAPVWPPPDYTYPPPVIRTRAPGEPVRLVFGSCRESSPLHVSRFPPDALDAYAVRLATGVRDGAPEWPDLLMLLGDQVYADETSKAMKKYLRRRERRRADAPSDQVVDFHEYTQLYLDSWTDPDIRWLLSTVPSVMIFDDHEIIDDWNISGSWRRDMHQLSWWEQRIRAGLGSYWVYQHLGNLAPKDVAADPVFQAVTAAGDATKVLERFGAKADSDRDDYRWSYALDLGRTRIVVLDNRAGRQLDSGERRMLPPAHWDWFADLAATGDCDHLVIGSSLPWLMPPAIHHIEAASERLCESRRGFVARGAEKVRRAVDLEHWAAFRKSFDALADLLTAVGSGEGAPATISVLSGDVHHSYVARADLPADSRIYQLTCSPVHNQLPKVMVPAMRFGWSRLAGKIGRGIGRLAGSPPPSVSWQRLSGPFFGNAVAELVHNGRSAHATVLVTKTNKTIHPAGELKL